MEHRVLESNESDAELISRIVAGETELFGELVRRYNQRLYRVCRAIVKIDHEAEDVVQESFVRAFEHLREFEARALFSTWLTRIALHEALKRRKHLSRETNAEAIPAKQQRSTRIPGGQEMYVLRDELRQLLEAAIDALPERYRLVFILRHVEEMSTSDTAHCLGISEQTVKIRLVRARTVLRRHLSKSGEAVLSDVFQFLGARCDRVTHNVLARLAANRQ